MTNSSTSVSCVLPDSLFPPSSPAMTAFSCYHVYVFAQKRLDQGETSASIRLYGAPSRNADTVANQRTGMAMSAAASRSALSIASGLDMSV